MTQQLPSIFDYFNKAANRQSSNNSQLKTIAAQNLSQFNRQVEQMFDSFFNAVPGMSAMEQYMPQMDMEEEEDKYVITYNIPAVNDDALSLNVKNGLLVLSYNEQSQDSDNRSNNRSDSRSDNSNRASSRSNSDSSERSGSASSRSRNSGRSSSRSFSSQSFSHTIPLPVYADDQNIEASYENGELVIEIQKLRADNDDSRIEIKSRESGKRSGSSARSSSASRNEESRDQKSSQYGSSSSANDKNRTSGSNASTSKNDAKVA